MIRVQNLNAAYGNKPVLKDISFSLPAGTLTGLLGPNGSGKTTLMSVAAGVLPAQSGTMEISVKDRAENLLGMSAKERARRIAFVPQKALTSFPLKCSSVVLMGRYPHLPTFGGYGREDVLIARKAMARAGVEHLWDRPTDAVSGGEFQRVLFARALAQGTDVMFLDEPSASLDMAGTVRLFDMLRETADAGGLVFAAVHDLNLAALYCDRLVFLKEGKIAGMGATGKVFNEETLSEIYGTDVRIVPHPVTGVPQAHMVPRHARHTVPRLASVG